MAEVVQEYRRRWLAQLMLLMVGQSIGFAGFLLTSLFRENTLPQLWPQIAACWYGLGILVFAGMTVALPYADPIILAVVMTLTGIGLATLHRLDLTSGDSPMLYTQFLATAIGVACLLVIIFLVKDPRRLRGYPFLLSAAGMVLLLLPLLPGLGFAVYGSRIWINLGPMSFQPAEIAKIVLAASFAAYLADKREVLSAAGRRVLRVELPRMRDLGPVMVMWGLSIVIMLFENDLGTSLLFFGMFVMMLYVATGKAFAVVLGLGLFAAAGAFVMRFAGHVQRRFDFWWHPFDFPYDATQIVQAQFGLSHGGLLGSGWGLGRPDLIIFASSDMIAAAIGEEIGLVGLFAIIVLYALLVFRGLKASLVTMDPFVKLFAAGLSFAFLLQTFAIIGGVTRLLPLTGLTTPFLSQGGSSMIANWILVAILLVISHQARRPQPVVTDSAAEITELGEEFTQVLSTRELAQIGTGAIHPLQPLEYEQVKLVHTPEPGGTAGEPDAAGSGEPGVVFDPDSTQAFDPAAEQETLPVTTVVPPIPAPGASGTSATSGAAAPPGATSGSAPPATTVVRPRFIPARGEPAPSVPPPKAATPGSPAAPATAPPAQTARPADFDPFEDDDDFFFRGTE